MDENNKDPASFYQFALEPEAVQATFEKLGFELIHRYGVSSLVGLADDLHQVDIIQQALEKISPRLTAGVSMLMDMVIGRYVGHSCILVLQKK